MALDLKYQLPYATVPANEPVSKHRVMHKMIQNVAHIDKFGLNNCATAFEHFH